MSFLPRGGSGQPRWRHAYDLVTSRVINEHVTLLEITEYYGCEQTEAWSIMRDAKKHLERDGLNTVKTIPKFGWVVIDAKGNLGEIDHRLAKTRRALSRTARLLTNTQQRRSELDQSDRNRLDFQTASVLRSQEIYNRTSPDFAALQRASKTPTQLPGLGIVPTPQTETG